MTTRNGRSVWQVCHVVGLWCLCVVAAPAAAHGDGSIAFNGGGAGTSKLQNENGNVLNGSNNMTICAWVYSAGQGEGGAGMLLALDKAGNGIRIHRDASSTLAFIAKFSSGEGKWTIPVTSNTWTAVAFSYEGDDYYNDPSPRVSFSSVTPTQVGSDPTGSLVSATSGYCVGNLSGNANTWDGRIAHVQVFSRALTAAEMDAALITPGSVQNGLRLWLPMTNATDVNDRSGNGLDATATEVTTGANSPSISRQQGIEAGTVLIPPGYTTVTQLVVPRYANGTSFPAGQIRGVGPASVLRANSATASLTDGTRAVVMTEDYAHASGIAFYQRTGSGPRPAVLRPIVRDLTIAGHDETGTSYGNRGLIDDEPGSWHLTGGTISGATNASPIVITTNVYPPATGSRVKVENVVGNTAANNTWIVTQGSTTVPYTFSLNNSTGNGSYTSGGTWTLQDLYHGALVLGSGSKVENSTFYYIPGTPLIMKGGTGTKNGQLGEWDSEKSRLWDCQFLRCYRGPEIALVDAVVGRIEGQGLRDYGILFSAGSTQIDGYMHFYGISPGPCMWFKDTGGSCWGNGPFYVENSPTGMLIDSAHNVLSNIHSHTCWVQNIRLNGWNNRLSELDIIAYHGAAGTGVGVYFQGFKNSISNGKVRLSNSANNAIFLHATASVHDGARIDGLYVEGPASGQGTGIKTDGTLNNCYIRVHLKNLNVGVDLFDGSNDRLGERNTIIVTHDGASDSGVTTPINFPAAWQTATPHTTTNFIMINDDRYYPPSDEAGP